jgi:hypothetical protein
MKRKLTWDEVNYIIKFEDACGVCNLLQYLFAGRHKAILGMNVDVLAEVEEKDGNP